MRRINFVSVQVIGGSFTRDYCIQDADTITAPTKVMKILYYASILAGEIDPLEFSHDEDNDSSSPDKAGAKPTSSQTIQVYIYIQFCHSIKNQMINQ